MQSRDYVKEQYTIRFDIEWFPPLGFNNSESMMLKKSSTHKTISDVVPHAKTMVLGAPAEFYSRQDGYTGLKEAYAIQFAKVIQLDPNLMYEALHQGEVDAIMGFTTSAKLDVYPIKTLEDDLSLFPRYDASILARKSLLDQDPKIQSVLGMLSGKIDEKTIRSLNYQVVVEKRAISQVVENYLYENKLISLSD